MCDEHTEKTGREFLKTGELSRRGMVVMSTLAGLAACTTTGEEQTTAAAEDNTPTEVIEQEVKITSPDGVIDAHYAAPSRGKHPAVLVWPDIMGLRGTFREMGKRLAASDFAVLTINPFYRKVAGAVIQPGESFSNPDVRNRLVPLAQSLNADTNKTDAVTCIDWLDRQPQVDTSKGVGTTGYCMGGPLVMRTCAYKPDRVRAGATFHGGSIATANANSPHLLVPQYKVKGMLIAIAQNDDQQDPESKNRLKQAFTAANIPAEVEVYPAAHGWCPPDNGQYNKEQAERAWSRLLATFNMALR